MHKVMSNEVPPDEKNGNVIPVDGKAPTTTPTFIKDCNTMLVVKPNTSKVSKVCFAEKAILYPLYAK